jgi:hypothetical protein
VGGCVYDWVSDARAWETETENLMKKM